MIAAATPAHSPPPPIGTITASRSGRLVGELEPERRGAERGARPLERMHERAPLRGLDLAHPRERPVDVLDQHHLGAVARQAATRAGLAVVRHHDLRGRAERRSPRSRPRSRGCPR